MPLLLVNRSKKEVILAPLWNGTRRMEKREVTISDPKNLSPWMIWSISFSWCLAQGQQLNTNGAKAP
jgi:hypothetical protein